MLKSKNGTVRKVAYTVLNNPSRMFKSFVQVEEVGRVLRLDFNRRLPVRPSIQVTANFAQK